MQGMIQFASPRGDWMFFIYNSMINFCFMCKITLPFTDNL